MIRDDGIASDAGSEDGAEEPVNRYRRLAIEAQSLEHRMCHLPKNPTCPICQRSRMYRKSVRKLRHDPLTDRGALEPVTHSLWAKNRHGFYRCSETQFGQRTHSPSHTR